MSVPIAVRRNWQRSVSDILVGGHGDAAFADYLITVATRAAFSKANNFQRGES